MTAIGSFRDDARARLEEVHPAPHGGRAPHDPAACDECARGIGRGWWTRPKSVAEERGEAWRAGFKWGAAAGATIGIVAWTAFVLFMGRILA